jgi:hypothetical protein
MTSFVMPGLPPTQPSLPVRGFFAAILGRPGSGKSTFASYWPDPVAVIDYRDQGLLDLASEGLLAPGLTIDRISVCDHFEKYLASLQAAVAGPRKTIICESIIGIQSLCESYTSTKDFEGDRSDRRFLNYQAGPRTAANFYMQQLLDCMLQAQNKGKHVLLIGHVATGMEKNILGNDFLAGRLSASKAMTERILATMMNVFVFVNEAETVYDKGTFKSNKTTNRLCYPHECSEYPSKNRLGLTGPFDINGSPQEMFLKFCAKTRRNPKTGYRSS